MTNALANIEVGELRIKLKINKWQQNELKNDGRKIYNMHGGD